jgi:uncharacterized membrane-anchored protein YitT (DUF2179 family)
VRCPRLKKLWTTSYFIDILFIFIGTGIYAFGIYTFTAPNQIAPGGVTGIAIVINAFTGFKIGTLVALFNIPLLLLGFKKLGKRFIFNTLLSTVFFDILVDYLYPFLPVYKGNLILASIFGGLFIGLGLAIVFMRGGSTGGMDIICKSVQVQYPHISLGKIVFVTDLIVITIAAISFRSIEAALYAVIAIFVSSKAIDALLYGTKIGKMIVIVSERSDDIAKLIVSDLARGCTILNAHGAYTGEHKKVLICACKDAEFYELKHIVKRLDSKAFMIVTEAGEVFGEGFSQIGGR